jgi:hypothetical protein
LRYSAGSQSATIHEIALICKNSVDQAQNLYPRGGELPGGMGWLESNLLFHSALLEENNLQ